MLFQTDIDKINAEIAQLQELIAAKQQRQNQLVHLQNIASEAVKSVQNVICLLSSPDARVTLKSAVVGLFDGIDDSSDTTPTPSASALDQGGGNNPPVKIALSPSRSLTPSLETTLVENFCRAGLVSVLEPEAAPEVAPAPSEEDSEPESAAEPAAEPAPEPELIQVTELVSYMREADGEIQCTYVGFNNKGKAQSWGEWLTSSYLAIASRFEVKPATKLPFKHELHVWGLNLNQVNKLAEQDFSKTPKAGFSASGMVNEESRGSRGRREAGGEFKADRSGNQSISEDIPEATTDHCLNGRVTGNEISHASPKAGGSEIEPTQTTAVIPAKVAPQLEHLEPGALVGSLLVPGWTYRVVEVRPHGQLNCTRLLSSGESFNVDLDINGVYLVEKAAYVAPEPEPEPESLADAPINTRHSQAAQSESPESEPTAAQLKEPMTPEKLAEFIRTAWSWEEIEAITASNEQYKKAAWSLLTQKEKDQVLVLKLESQQKEKPTPEPEPPRASVQ